MWKRHQNVLKILSVKCFQTVSFSFFDRTSKFLINFLQIYTDAFWSPKGLGILPLGVVFGHLQNVSAPAVHRACASRRSQNASGALQRILIHVYSRTDRISYGNIFFWNFLNSENISLCLIHVKNICWGIYFQKKKKKKKKPFNLPESSPRFLPNY